MTCAEPGHIAACPLPSQPLRNGHLNQMAYSLFLFMRDIADDDFVEWIDRQLAAVKSESVDRLPALREAILGPLRNVYGVADKVLAMALSSLPLSAGQQRPLWREVGVSLVAVDTLVHNFLHRTGILKRLGAEHPYGVRCYRPADALTFWLGSPPASTPGSSILPSPKPFHALCRMRSGAIAPRTAWTSATATASTMAPVATIATVSCFDTAIASLCAQAKTSRKFNGLKQLTTSIGCSIVFMQLFASSAVLNGKSAPVSRKARPNEPYP
jgi:hypothetical protein